MAGPREIGYNENGNSLMNDAASLEASSDNSGGNDVSRQPSIPYVPPIEQSPLKIHLTTTDGSAVEFFEDSKSKGIGAYTTVIHNPSTAFGSRREYTASINGGRILSKFIVSIINFDSFSYDGNSRYVEGIRILEYRWENEQWTEQPLPRTFNFTAGTIQLDFGVEKVKLTRPQPAPTPSTPTTVTVSNPNPNSQYEISFGSNLNGELGNSLNLVYNIFYGTNIVSSGVLGLGQNKIGELSDEVLLNSIANFSVEGNLPDGITVEQIYGGVSSQITDRSFTGLEKFPYAFSVPASRLKSSFVVVVDAAKEIKFAEPKITLTQTQFNIGVKESDLEREVSIPFNTESADSVLVYTSSNKFIEVPASNGRVTLFFQKDFDEIYGTKKVILVAQSNNFGTGQRAEALITFTAINDYPSITEVTFADAIDVPSFSDFNIGFDVKWNSFATTSVDIYLKLKDGSYVVLFTNQSSNGSITLNLKTLREKYPNWSGSDNVTLKLKPYNRGGVEELIGNDYEVVTKLTLPTLYLDDDILKSALFQAFGEKLSVIEPEPNSKYLTHLANFGNNEQILISSWENDNWTLSKKSVDELGNEFVKDSDEVESVILKLYSPLNPEITNNSTFWITKLMSNPLIETVVLTEQSELKCPPLKGPDFNIDVDFTTGQSTNYESLDNLILSASVLSSSKLVSTYLSSSIFSTDGLNIEYAKETGDGASLFSSFNVNYPTYLWDNFVHFSSAKERVDNFVYKVQLIETYEQLILSASTDTLNTGFINSPASQQEVERQTTKKNQLINNFDGFEIFLYTPSNLGSWPYDGEIRMASSTDEVKNWYENIINSAEEFDIENPNYVQNNIPQYIVNNGDNESLLLFFSMIGQHFDNIYYHTKAIEKSRGFGYKSKGGISDKLLFESLKSFGWDANNLAADKQLWNYVFGMDSEGSIKEVSPAKQRTYEVWRRIINNLPYLLKHKGTRRGVYALMSCYGIPASNLTILEFGGPEITTDTQTKSKLEMSNITTALKFNDGASISMDWKDTDKGIKPSTLEMFVKPAYSGDWVLLETDNWSVSLNGSLSSNYGVVKFSGSSSTFETPQLPIFNGKFFGLSVSSGSGGIQLDVRQTEKERTIFSNSTTQTISVDWESDSTLTVGSNYIGSLDEFRLWSTPLDKERFYEHVAFPEMINGNHISSSTDDLYFRLDFEYPKNLAQTSSLINVDTNIYFSSGVSRNQLEGGIVPIISGSTILSENSNALYSASVSGFSSSTSYPFQFEAIDRSFVLEIPDLGSGRYSTNKVRFESQELVSNLSSNSRATKKAFDKSPTDSNRVGLFFSPTKELNFDIAKSFGGINLDNYIGNPDDSYKSNYKDLDNLRNYYFKRFNGRDIYQYINLIKLYEKSMFEDIKKMLPARVKATTGLLIEPHILERSKVAYKRPSAEDYQQEVNIKYSDTTIMTSENNQYDAFVDADMGGILTAENNQYDALITTASVETVIAENYQQESIIDANSNFILETDYYQKEVVIDAGLGEPTILTEISFGIETYGQTDYETIGFGIYAQSGSAIRTYFDRGNRVVKERVRVNLVTEQKTRLVDKFNVVVPGIGKGDPRGGFYVAEQTYTETKLNIQPFSGSTMPIVKGNIIDVKPVNGYLPTHNKFTSDLTIGLQNSFYKGSKNTAATTLDGTPPIETFTSNPNTLKVNKAGRTANEPILEVE
jgi:hypothetical protein